MAITVSNPPTVSENKTVAATSFTTTTSISPVAGRYYVLFICAQSDGTSPVPTLSGGGGLSFVQLDTVVVGGGFRLTAWRAQKPSGLSSGTITADFAGNSQNTCKFVLLELTDTPTDGTDGSGAAQQVAHNNGSGTSSSVTLSPFEDPTNNAAIQAVANGTTQAITQEAGWTELADMSAGPRAFEVSWRTGEDTTPTSSWTSSDTWIAMAMEVREGLNPAASKRTLLGVGS